MFINTTVHCLYAQNSESMDFEKADFLDYKAEAIQTDSGLLFISFYRGNCKNFSVQMRLVRDSIPVSVVHLPVISTHQTKPDFLTIHGNISYDFFYRSKIDTPFIQQNLKQHTERIWLDILIKEKYPFKVALTATQSNSPFFKDLVSMNLNFDKYSFNKNIKKDLLSRLETVKWENSNLKIIDSALKEKLNRYQTLKKWINGPEALQRIIEERERVFYNKKKNEIVPKEPHAEEIPIYHDIKLSNGRFLTEMTDSLASTKKEGILSQPDSSFTETLQVKKDELDKLEKSIATLKRQLDSIKTSINQNISKVKQSIYKASNSKELKKIAKQNGISQPESDKLQNFLSNIKTLDVGRTMIDYTELTAQNVMLTGVNIEYNPSYYTAFAAGKIDYGFRDFFGRGIKQMNQYLILGRMGWGDKDKQSVILTLFNGRKNNYAGLLAADSSNNTAFLLGYSIKTILKKNENTFLSFEVAKSTKSSPPTFPASIDKADNLFNYSDFTNMGLNIKAQTAVSATDTRLSGFFRKTGEAFQSFSMFTYNTNQQAWQLRADQSFLKRKINLTAMLRQNDFTNPLASQTFKTSTVFKALQLNVRVSHWPTLNAGYYPGSQFYIVDNNTVRENAYYILNGSVLHAYRYKEISMNSSIIYNRYFNQATDSGFVLYKGINYVLSHALIIKKLQLESSYSHNKQSELNYYTLDANGDYSLNKFLRLGGGVKYSHVEQGQSYWGESIRLSANFKNLGGLQLHYEKSYLPTIQQTLYPVEIGRVSWYKIF